MNLLRHPEPMQGKLIVFEGGEGSGKTTQIQQLQAWLTQSGLLAKLQQQGWISQLILTREPGGTPLGQTLRQLLLASSNADLIQDRTELLLYAADRAQHVESYLKPLLAQGALVLCDRYTDSTVAYQGYGRGLDRGLIDQLNQISTGGLQSHLTFWLDIDAEIGLMRAKNRAVQDRMEQTQLSFHQRVRQGFDDLAQENPDRIVRIDAHPDQITVAQHIQAILSQKLRAWYGEA